MNGEARAILDEAGETLARVADIKVEHRDSGEYWSRPKPEPEPHTSHNGKYTDAETLRWQSYIDGKIAAANAARDEFWRDVLGSLISEVRKQLRSEISAEVGLLRADVEIQRKAAERGDHDRGGDVVELPNPLRSVRHG